MATPISTKNKFSWTFHTPTEMARWGRRLAARLKPGDVVALIGPLGAGKTTLVQSVTKAWGYKCLATSPTFALVNEYRTARANVYHMDMYRLSPKEVALFPVEEYQDDSLCLIEWADRLGERLPAEALRLQLSHGPHGSRVAWLPRLQPLWKKRLAGLGSHA